MMRETTSVDDTGRPQWRNDKALAHLRYRLTHLLLPLALDVQGVMEAGEGRYAYAVEVVKDYRTRAQLLGHQNPFLQLAADFRYLLTGADKLRLEDGLELSPTVAPEEFPDGRPVMRITRVSSQDPSREFSSGHAELERLCNFGECEPTTSPEPGRPAPCTGGVLGWLRALDAAAEEGAADKLLGTLLAAGAQDFGGEAFLRWYEAIQSALESLVVNAANQRSVP